MIDMELFELMKVTLKEVLRSELSPSSGEYPPSKLVADRAYEYARDAQLRLQREPLHDQHAPTIQPPPPITNRSCSRCVMRALYGSDFCKDHQPMVAIGGARCAHRLPGCQNNVILGSDFCIDHQE